jgi:hypothetical protein
MKLTPALALVAATLCGSAHAVDVYKWTDSKGVVHYGDHPASGVAASTLSVPGGGDSAEEQAAAEASLDAAREKLAEPTSSAAQRYRPRSQPAQQQTAASVCAAAWAQYAAAQACFDAHRAAGGKGVSGVGTVVCQDVPQPSCTR